MNGFEKLKKEIRKACKNRNRTYKHIGIEAGWHEECARQNVWAVMHRNKTLSTDTLQRICKALGLDPKDFV